MTRHVRTKLLAGLLLAIVELGNVSARAGGGCPGVMVMNVAGHCHLTKIGADAFNWRQQQATSGRGFSNPTNPTPADRTVSKLADWEWRHFHRTPPAGIVQLPQQNASTAKPARNQASAPDPRYAIPNNALKATSDQGYADCKQLAAVHGTDTAWCEKTRRDQADDRSLVRKFEEWAKVLVPEFGNDMNPIGEGCSNGLEKGAKYLGGKVRERAGEVGERAAKLYNHGKDIKGAALGDDGPEPTTTVGKVFKACTQ